MTTIMNDTNPPSTILASFIGFLVSTASVLASAVVVLTARPELLDGVRATDAGRAMTEEGLQTFVTGAQAFTVGISVLMALFYLLLSFKLKAGRNWARVVLTVLTVLQVAALFTTEGNTWVSYASCVVTAVALVFAYLPASNAYIAAARRTG